MRAPRLASVIERRLLVNYRTDPAVTARLLPAPLRPRLVNGWAVSGVCLIRLGAVHPAAVSARFGPGSENAAHRIAVEWDTPAGVAHGVYIPRRDTGSRLNAWAGGRLFPGRHHRARFDVREAPDELRIAVTGDAMRVEVHVRPTEALPDSQLFGDLHEASEFFRHASSGFSVTPDPSRLDGVELHTPDWRVTPVALTSVRSSFHDDPAVFPPGTATPDCALLMRDVAANWHPLPPMPVEAPANPLGAGESQITPASGTAR